VGVSKIKSKGDFSKAINEAFAYDNKIIVEENINGREIECSVLGNKKPIASLPGEVIPQHEFYSYEAKYLDDNGALFQIPAPLPEDIIKSIQTLAIKTFQTLNCEGMGRVDFFLDGQNKIFINEINTIPGFTKISMYPKLWEVSGIGYSQLINTIIELALQRFHKEKRLKNSYTE
jgi:D-alanine-D-alanine ligase